MLRHVRAFVAFAIAISFLAGVASAATISPSVSPTRGSINSEYAFVVRYAGVLPVASADVFIDDVQHPMREVDATDDNYTNGKDYSHVSKLPEGSHVYYFLIVDSNGTDYRSAASIVVVDPLLDWGHFDVALAVMLFMIPLFYVMYLMRRATKALEKVAKRLEMKEEKSEPGNAEPTVEKPQSKAEESEVLPKQG